MLCTLSLSRTYFLMCSQSTKISSSLSSFRRKRSYGPCKGKYCRDESFPLFVHFFFYSVNLAPKSQSLPRVVGPYTHSNLCQRL